MGTTINWVGEKSSVNEMGVDASNPSRVLVKIDPQYFRPTEVELLIGSAAKAKAALGWQPKIMFQQLVEEMVAADLALVDKGDMVN